MCNTSQWNADEWLSLNEDSLSYRISGHHELDVLPGQLGILRLNDDRRSNTQRKGRPKLQAGIYAIFEVVGRPFFGEDEDVRHYSNEESSRPRWRVGVRVIANLLHAPVLASDLPDSLEFSYIHRPLQTSTIPISEDAFFEITSKAGYDKQRLDDLRSDSLPATQANISNRVSSAIAETRVFIANFGRENYEWPECLAKSTVANMNGIEEQGFWEAGDKESYIQYCMDHSETAAGLKPTRPVASRWFNLMTTVAESVNDIWIHREKEQLWWTQTNTSAPTFVLESTPFLPNGEDQVYVCHKPCHPWSNSNLKGNKLEWRGLHPRAREFLFTEGTLQQLSAENSLYAKALIRGDSLAEWHDSNDWKAKAEFSKKEPVKTFSNKEISIERMAKTAWETAAHANGQDILRSAKIKNFEFPSRVALEEHIAILFESQEGLCAISGLPLQFDREVTDPEFACSLDRVDSNGHYAKGNLQIVCKFINRWKSSENDKQFRRLFELVKTTG